MKKVNKGLKYESSMIKKEDLKVAFVSLQRDAEKTPPIGLVYLATYLSEVVGLRKENIRIFDKNYFDVEKEITEFNPDIVGVTAMTLYYNKAVSFSKNIRKILDAPIIVGGVHISTLPESFSDCFEVGVMGEGEETFADLVNLYLKKKSFLKKDLAKIESLVYLDNGKLIQTRRRKPLDLDTLPLPDFNFIHKDYFKRKEIPGVLGIGIRAFLISSRGCPYRCQFCSTSRFWGKMRLHSPEYTARLAEKLIKEHNADYIEIIDDLFTISPARLRSIKEEFDRRNLLGKIRGISCMVRANLMTDELCKAMGDMKIKIINFGFESGSDRFLKYLKSGSVSLEMNKKAVLLGKKYGFNVYGSLMYGSPGEKIEDMEKTNEFIDFCIKNGARNIWSFVATPFPATPFWEIGLQRKTVSNDMNFELLDHHISQRPLLLDSDISTEDFRGVFESGRKKLRVLRSKLIFLFFKKNFGGVIRLVFSEPRYYFDRIIKQLFRQ